jgi:hypothetical protein
MNSATATSSRMLKYSIRSGESAYIFDTSFEFIAETMSKRRTRHLSAQAPTLTSVAVLHRDRAGRARRRLPFGGMTREAPSDVRLSPSAP